MPHTILLIDDSEVDRATYKRFLHRDDRQSYQLIEFSDGEEALTWCQQHEADIILLDYHLIEMDGLDFLRQLQQQRPDDILPVIMMTGLGNTSVAVEAIKLGAQDYLEKDRITPENLPQLVRNVFQQIQLKRKLSRQQAQQQSVIEMALWMRQSLDLQTVLDGTTQGVRQFLQVDRTLIYQFAPDWQGTIVSESVESGYPIALGQQIQDTCFQQGAGVSYHQGHVWAIADVAQASLTDCHRALLERFAVKANLVIPIFQNISAQPTLEPMPSLWGLLIAHHCSHPHPWQEEELTFLKQVALHLSGAIQQATLYQQAQTELVERKQAELALQESEEKLRLLIKHSPVSIAMFDREMRYIMASQRWVDDHDKHSRTIEDYIGHSHYEIYPDIPERWKQVHQRCLAGAVEGCDEDLFVIANAPPQWVRWETRPWYTANSEIGGIVIFSEEITNRKQAEIALSKSQAQLRLAQATSNSGVWDWDILTNTLFWSPEYYKLYRLDPSVEPTYENWLLCIYPDDREQVSQQILSALDNGSCELRVEFRVLHSDNLRWFAGIGQIFRNDVGEATRFIGITIDITTQKQTELALQESEARLRHAILKAPIPIMLQADNGEVLLLNQTWTDLTGYTQAEIPTLATWTEKAHGDRKAESQTIFNERFSSQLETYAGEFYVTTKSGDTRIWDFYIAPLGNLPDGRRFVIRMAVDYTERRLAETQLQAIVDSSELVVYLKDREGRYLLSNRWYERLTQFKSSEILGRTDFDLYPIEAAQLFRQNDQYVLTTGTSLQFEETVPLPEGERIYLALKFPLYDANGRIYAVCGMSTDITKLKQTQDALHQSNEKLQAINQDLERANQAKDAFLRMMSHELRTPLNPILGMAETLQAELFGSLNDRQQRSVSAIRDNGQHLLTLINNILQLVDLEASNIRLERHAVSVKSLCESSLATIQAQAAAKSIQLQTHIAPEINIIQVDGDRLKQVLALLLENAVKFTPDGGTITVGVQVCAICSISNTSATLFVQFSIQDTGIGIAPESLQNLFQFFTQVDNRLARSYNGIGIGLALVRRLVELHQGHITVASHLGEGSCFTVNIPV